MSRRTNGSRIVTWALYLIVALLALWLTIALTGHSVTDGLLHHTSIVIRGH